MYHSRLQNKVVNHLRTGARLFTSPKGKPFMTDERPTAAFDPRVNLLTFHALLKRGLIKVKGKTSTRYTEWMLTEAEPRAAAGS